MSYIPICPMASHHMLEPHRQQAVSGITELPADIFEGSGQNFHTFGLLRFTFVVVVFCSHWNCAGFEYFGDPNSRSDGYITWQMDDTPTIRMGAGAVGPDQGTDGSGVSQRLISEEPMVRSCHPFTLPLLIGCLVHSHEPGHVAYVMYFSHLIPL